MKVGTRIETRGKTGIITGVTPVYMVSWYCHGKDRNDPVFYHVLYDNGVQDTIPAEIPIRTLEMET